MNKYLLFLGLVICASCSKKGASSPSGGDPNPATTPQYGTPYTNIPATTADITMYEVNERATVLQVISQELQRAWIQYKH